MKSSLVMTILGEDRPGLVEELSTLVSAYEGNWEESRMAHLAGHFAGILKVVLPEEQRDGFLAALDALKPRLSIQVSESQDTPASTPLRAATIEIVGQDRPGIVSQITRAMTAHLINVDELSTECSSAPMSAEQLFKARARIRIPDSISLEALRDELEQIAADLMIDLVAE
ncbi:MAG: glycine cleavage system regulatory protein [Kiritimatiellia bacterium]|jgi:glycine cleavage system regulatory protein